MCLEHMRTGYGELRILVINIDPSQINGIIPYMFN